MEGWITFYTNIDFIYVNKTLLSPEIVFLHFSRCLLTADLPERLCYLVVAVPFFSILAIDSSIYCSAVSSFFHPNDVACQLSSCHCLHNDVS